MGEVFQDGDLTDEPLRCIRSGEDGTLSELCVVMHRPEGQVDMFRDVLKAPETDVTKEMKLSLTYFLSDSRLM